jgi:hypothetical protein
MGAATGPTCAVGLDCVGGQRIAQDDRRRPQLTEVLNRYENELARDANAFPKVAEEDFDTHA